MTHKEYYAEIKTILENAERDDLVAFIDGRLEALEKKSTGKKENPNAKENIEIKEKLFTILEDGAPRTISMLISQNEELTHLTNQRLSYILNLLIKEGTIKKEKYKKYMYYFLADGGTTPEEWFTKESESETDDEEK